MERITVRKYIDGQFPSGATVLIPTAWGNQEVTGINWPETNPWIVCGKENAGFGISYAVCYGTPLYYVEKVQS